METGPAALFHPEPGICYLDSATYGLPPQPTVDAMTEAIETWQRGTARWIDDWDMAADRARADFAGLAGLAPIDVGVIPSASVGVGVVAASLTGDDRVVVPDDEFTSLLFPLLVAEERVGATVDSVPFDEVLGAIDERTTLVATSLVQMQTGRVAPLADLVERTHAVGATLLLDATHGLPFVQTSGVLPDVDIVVCAAYKHLLCPRGVAFIVVRPEHRSRLAPWNANWRSTPEPYGRYFGGPLDLAAGAAAFDVSIAWLPWVGAAVSLGLLRAWSADGWLDQPRKLAQELATGLDVEWYGSSIVCVPVSDADVAMPAIDAAGLKVGLRGGAVRLSTHVYTTPSDVDRAVEVIEPFVDRSVDQDPGGW